MKLLENRIKLECSKCKHFRVAVSLPWPGTYCKAVLDDVIYNMNNDCKKFKPKLRWRLLGYGR